AHASAWRGPEAARRGARVQLMDRNAADRRADRPRLDVSHGLHGCARVAQTRAPLRRRRQTIPAVRPGTGAAAQPAAGPAPSRYRSPPPPRRSVHPRQQSGGRERAGNDPGGGSAVAGRWRREYFLGQAALQLELALRPALGPPTDVGNTAVT